MPNYKTKTVEIDAWQFTGSLKKAPLWVLQRTSDKDEKVIFRDPAGEEQELPENYWIVRDHTNNIISLPDDAFQHSYEKIVTTKK